MPEVFVHLVMVSFWESVPQETRERKLADYRALGDACGGRAAGILYWDAGWNRDQRKGYHLIEFGIFSDADAFQRFRAHPVHAVFAAEMSQLADWVVGDLATALPGF